ncbi:MAG TPA: hypothetical protein VN924_05515 [Bryobacteraceae bacterium]|nr:hypothetical protein [Bryobacteraceae bacterium]
MQQHMYLVFDNFVDSNIGPRGKHKRSGVVGQPYSSTVRKSAELSNGSVNPLCYLLRGGGVIFADPLNDAGEVVGRIGRPLEPASCTKHLLDALDHFVMLQQIATARGRSALFHGRNEMFVVFQHPVNRLLNYLRGAFADAGCGLLQTGLFFR